MKTNARTKQLGTEGKKPFETLQSREAIFQQLAFTIGGSIETPYLTVERGFLF
jgi:hypothetical protein